MPQFSQTSKDQLQTCHQDLQLVFHSVIEKLDCTIVQGHRSTEEQHRLYEEGKTLVMHSKHNDRPSRAVDVAPYPINWNDTEGFYRFAYFVLGVAHVLGVDLRWGGDWDRDWDHEDQRFNDLVHFELP